ncbi:MAG: 50S ribosomal protein L31 [Candidatus Gracilibacteria bacterium]|nr:50S ribosomal protein L31 [Candidatus Gracilibacteria bacterium]MDD2909221.1 50S ribosomal protein L31 [Candidatus Gracilibacteria bacterium]
MKKTIHPAFSEEVTVTCSCGNTFNTGSTVKGDIRVETCSKCHPFYTGERKILKTGAGDKFTARQLKTKELQK